MPRKKANRTADEIRKQKREAEKRRRDRIQADPVRRAEYKAKEKLRRQKRKDQKKDVSISEMSDRNQRTQRKMWRESSRKYRQNKKAKAALLRRLQEDSPPSSDVEGNAQLMPVINDLAGDHESTVRSETASPSIILENNLGSVPNSPLSQHPQSPISVCSAESACSSESRQKLAGTKRAKHGRYLKNKIIEQQKLKIETLKKKIHALAQKVYRQNLGESARNRPATIRSSSKQLNYIKKKIKVQRFLEKDENSKLCPGKKDSITRSGKKKQKRYLCDSLDNLHKKYKIETGLNISYTTFTRFRPFWIVTPKVTARDTCACTFHENVNLMIIKLHQLGLIREKSIQEVVDSVTCNRNNYKCMTRKCAKCRHTTLEIATFDNSEIITYNQWIKITEKRLIKSKERVVPRVVKSPIECCQKTLINKLVDLLPKLLEHVLTISEQYKALNQIKTSLIEGEVLLHIDFSENYQCKYSKEVQSVHYGASRQQISLHTCVLYYKHEDLGVIPFSFCSVSDCLRHDAAAIYAHLIKSLKQVIQEKNIKIEKLHILSDGPSGQYKNKSNFYLFSQKITKDLNLKSASWNFSESGHGKGPADGIGATIKRTADAIVAQGQDIPDFITFVTKMVVRTKIYLITVTESDVKTADTLLPKQLKAIPETKKIHQLTWTSDKPQCIYLRELTCVICSLDRVCAHFPVKNGFFKYSQDFIDVLPATVHQATAEEEPETISLQKITFEANRISYEDFVEAGPSGFCNNKTILSNVTHCNIEVESRQFPREASMKTVGSWIVVEFEGKKKPAHFIGQITSIQRDDEPYYYVVKFLRKKNLTARIFVWQEPEDVSLVLDSDIVLSLPEPTPTRRGELQFDFDFLKTKYYFK